MQDYIEVEGVRYVREESVVLSVDTEHRGSQNQMGVKCPYCKDSSGLHFDEVRLENAAGQKLTARGFSTSEAPAPACRKHSLAE